MWNLFFVVFDILSEILKSWIVKIFFESFGSHKSFIKIFGAFSESLLSLQNLPLLSLESYQSPRITARIFRISEILSEAFQDSLLARLWNFVNIQGKQKQVIIFLSTLVDNTSQCQSWPGFRIWRTYFLFRKMVRTCVLRLMCAITCCFFLLYIGGKKVWPNNESWNLFCQSNVAVPKSVPHAIIFPNSSEVCVNSSIRSFALSATLVSDKYRRGIKAYSVLFPHSLTLRSKHSCVSKIRFG